MIYQAALPIPAQTDFMDRLGLAFTMPRGTITRLSILFPSGCAGLAHIRIMHNEYQVWPTTPGQSFIGDGNYMVFDETYTLPDAWNYIRVEGWNEDDSYQHTINLWLAEEPAEQSWTWGAASEGLVAELGGS